MSEYRSYPSRWGVLITVAMLNISVNALFISYSSISTLVSEFYEVSVGSVDLLTAIVYIVGVFVGALTTWLVDRVGFRYIILWTAIFIVAGGGLRCLSTIPGIDKTMEYWMAFFGQALLGVANPVAFCMPPKVALDWFPEKEQTIATGLITMSFAFGIAISTGLTPVLFTKAEDVPYVNITWSIPPVITLVLAIVLVRRSRPLTPPSKSAELAALAEKGHFWHRIKKVMKSPMFLAVLYVLGGAIGSINALISQIQQILCARGYENWFAGLCSVIIQASGVIGGLVGSIFAQKTGLVKETAKVCICLGVSIAVVNMQLLNEPNLAVPIAVFLGISGFFSTAVMPLGFELSSEAIYPIEPAIGSSIIFITAQAVSYLLIFIAGFVETDLREDFYDIQTCGDDPSDAKNHTAFLLIITFLFFSEALVLVFFATGKYNRRLANQLKKSDEEQVSSAIEVEGERKRSTASAKSKEAVDNPVEAEAASGDSYRQLNDD